MELDLLFSCQICSDNLNLNVKSLEQYAYRLMETTKGRHFTNMGGWQSDFIDEDKEVQDLIFEINRRIEVLRKVFNYSDDLNLKVESMWININQPYSYNTRHTHPDSYISGSFYIKTPKNSGDIVFKHPSVMQPLNSRNNVIKAYNMQNSSKWNVTPNENQLLLFPGWVEHEVCQNMSKEDRISVAFNTAFYDKV